MEVQHLSTPAVPDKRKSKKKKQKMSAEQKRFVLSKDTGTYSQLNPVSAEEASSDIKVEVKEVQPPEEVVSLKPTDTQPGGFIGNYYLLDLDNFADQQKEGEEEKGKEEEERKEEEEKERKEEKVVDALPGQPSAHRTPQYENVSLTLSDHDQPQARQPSPDSIQHTSIPEPTQQLLEEEVFVRTASSGTAPIDIPTSFPSQRRRERSREDYTTVEVCGEEQERQFKIAEDRNEDVMVSKMNPNYERVELRRNRQRIPEDDRPPLASPTEEIQIIMNREDPFAGLVQSSSGVTMDTDPSAPRQRLTSVWDDFRVDKEWNQVTTPLPHPLQCC